MLDFGCEGPEPQCNNILDPCGVSQEEFICQALKLLPPGSLWNRTQCNFASYFVAIAATYWAQWHRTCGLRTEVSPCTADMLLDEWASVWRNECDDFPTDPEELREVLCNLMKSRGILSCDIITQEMARNGYNVISCCTDKRTTGELVTPGCGFSLGWSSLSGGAVFLRTDTCEDRFEGYPCAADCCDGSDAVTVPAPDPCNIESNGAYCHSNCGCHGLGAFVGGECYHPLLSPFTLRVFIDKDSPAIDPCDLPGPLLPAGMQMTGRSSCVDVKEACTITAMKPAHLTIEYVVCDADKQTCVVQNACGGDTDFSAEKSIAQICAPSCGSLAIHSTQIPRC